MNPRKILGIIYRAFAHPAKRKARFQPVRSMCRLPIVYDIISLFLQLRDLNRLSKIKDHLATTNSNAHYHQVHLYNADVTQEKLVTSTRRAEIYYKLLSFFYRPLNTERLLVVGPRNIQELFTAWTYGWSWNNIQGIDLYSTNPKIIVMNMEKMDFKDSSFGAVAMANTLSYADDTNQALSEVARILRPGGWFSFSATFDPNGSTWKEDGVDGKSLAEMLHNLNFEICGHFVVDKINSQKRRQTSHDFLVRLIPENEENLDPFRL